MEKSSEIYIPKNLKLITTSDKGLAMITNKIITKGEIICALMFDSFKPREIASDYSVQIGENFFADLSSDSIDKYINHSCDPNTALNLNIDYSWFAIKNIKKEEEITYNYLTTEYDLVIDNLDFDCKCGSENCLGRVRGFKYLTRQQQRQLWPYLSPYLKMKLK